MAIMQSKIGGEIPMSLISVVATTDFISIMSDGLVKKGSKIVEENMQKYVVFNNRAFIGFTGTGENIDFILSNIPLESFGFLDWIDKCKFFVEHNSLPYPDNNCFSQSAELVIHIE